MTELKAPLKPGLDLLISVSSDQTQHSFSFVDSLGTKTPVLTLTKSWLTSSKKREELFLALADKLPEKIDDLDSKLLVLSVKILEALNKVKKNKAPAEVILEKIDWIPEPLSFNNLHSIYSKWIYMKDDYALRFTVATAVSQQLPGIPFWGFLVSPASNGKSVYITALGDIATELSYPMSEFTAASLITGHGEGEDLMVKFDGKIVPITDFSSFLSHSEEERNKILSKLRVMFDGKYKKAFGGEIAEKEIKVHCTIVAGVTNDIERQRDAMALLGDRYLFARVTNDDDKASEKAQEVSDNEKEGEMTTELKRYTLSFIKQVWTSNIISTVTITEELKKQIRIVAKFLAVMRTPVSLDHQGRYNYTPASEGSMRLTKQLTKLAKSLAAIDGRIEVNEDDMSILKRVCIDSIPELRAKTISSLIGDDEETDKFVSNARTIDEIAMQSKLPERTMEKHVSDLKAIGAIEDTIIETTDAHGLPQEIFGVQLIPEVFNEFNLMLGDAFSFNYNLIENIKRKTKSFDISLISSKPAAESKVIKIDLYSSP